jgi:hypothetical protein
MTDGQTFLLVFILIYLSDCLIWLPPSGYAVLAFSGHHFLVRRAAVSFHAVRKGFAVLQPLPPFGTVFAGQAWPLSLDREGIAPLSRENPNPGPAITAPTGARHLHWSEVETIVAEESKLLVNGRTYAFAATAAAAHDLTRSLERVRNASDADREKAISKVIARNLNARRPARKARLFFRAVRGLRWNASILFVAVFFVIPYAYWRFEDDPPFYYTLLAVWLVMCQIVVEFWLLHRRFFPTLGTERWTHAILSILFPHYAMRSIDVLSRGFLAESHPLAVAVALADRGELARFADRVRRDTLNPIPFSGEDPALASRAEHFRLHVFLPAVERLLSGMPDLQEPAIEGRTTHPDEVSECPRCRIPYDRVGLVCQDCGGIPTVQL